MIAVPAFSRGRARGPSPGPRFPSSFAVVVQRTRRWWTCNAGNGAQIFVDGEEVTVRHVVIDRPWHYLEKIAIERRWEAVCGYGS